MFDVILSEAKNPCIPLEPALRPDFSNEAWVPHSSEARTAYL